MAWKHVQHPMYEVRNAKGHSNVRSTKWCISQVSLECKALAIDMKVLKPAWVCQWPMQGPF